MKSAVNFLVLLLIPVLQANGDTVNVSDFSDGGSVNVSGFPDGGNYQIPVKSFVDLRFKTVYRQRYDFSCGSAALASLLSFHYGDIVNEQEVFLAMYEKGDKEKIHKLGFSMLDMKDYLEGRGYRANGFRFNLDQLNKVGVPAITLINNQGYMHFVIIKGINDRDVLVGDPAVGVKAIPRDEFEQMWGKRILFLIQNKSKESESFNASKDWNIRVKAPLGIAVDRSSLAEFNLIQPGRFDF